MNRYRLRSDGTIKTEHEIRESFNGFLPAVIDSFTCDFLGVDPVLQSPKPSVDDAHTVIYIGVVQDGLGNWVDSWGVEALPPEQVAEITQRKIDALMKSIVDATQERLDEFARTRNYDGILSACTYATSAVPKFHSEGTQCVAARDATWAALYTFMAEVNTNVRPMPSSFADVEPLLPPLTWSNE